MTTVDNPVRDTVGAPVRRADGTPKVRGEFAFSSDLDAPGMLWGATIRSPHPHARVLGVDASAATAMKGVRGVLTHHDIPGTNRFGLERRDQPVLAADLVRYAGEPVAVVAADDPGTASKAAKAIVVEYEVLEPLTDPEAALRGAGPVLHEGGNIVAHRRIRKGSGVPEADVVVTGTYEVGMQDQAFLGPESCLAVPGGDGGVDLFCSTQWLHIDRDQLCDVLALPEDKVRLTLSGVGGAFGGREDLSVQAHACLLALRLGRPVKMVYDREESFVGHVHRHPAWLEYEHGATKDGKLVYVKARILLDGGAYASTSHAVTGNAGCFAAGPYEVPTVHVDSYSVYTNNPPCGAMRGFGAVQACFGYESQMDKLAAALNLDPVELRLRNAVHTGSAMATGQRIHGPAPVAELLTRVRDMPLPEAENSDVLRPGGTGNTTDGEGVRRGVGYGVSVKNICKSLGYDDYGTARVRLAVADGKAAVWVHTAAAEVGQGLVTVQAQIARTELGVGEVTVVPADTAVGDAGTSSASRQTWVSGGAVKAACDAVREAALAAVAPACGEPAAALRLEEGHVVSAATGRAWRLADVLGEVVIDETRVYRHRETFPIDPETGQGDGHVAFAFAAHRAVVDVDVDLGLVRVVEIACAEDVGKAMNPPAVEGQMHGGIAQGLGLALMEEIQVEGGLIRNPSFTDYLIPTTLDMPAVKLDILELPRDDSPYGLTGVGEPSLLSCPAAVVAAIRDATGVDVTRIPVRPDALATIVEAGEGDPL
ncbi:xanthine dehydrogenase subunit D [Prauserella marina]|uniref:Xanthine dehydrogenase D subunit n=1 Tax=Prauserella marina TaxID=530584 RepID=A0A222VN09_9PSEU|nr:xanthine dehydrogenase subunit D [Prauserella marina]ASR35242.1 xanthine dehydrogenase subunit D [Prauserella marina]PWV84985.1 xanthine dehydrogenase molybdenum binding subunit apoprotein [Prauserella marina]SDC07565.1 xanthine dehydrogenase D subunit [Prauserella marina]